MDNAVPSELRDQIIRFQCNEITEHQIYSRLAKNVCDPENRQVLEQIAADELRHYHGWKRYTQVDVTPNRWLVFFYYWISS